MIYYIFILIFIALVSTKNIYNEKIRRIRNKFKLEKVVEISKTINSIDNSSKRKYLPSCDDFLEYNIFPTRLKCSARNVYCIDKKENIYGISTLNECKMSLYYDVFLFEIIEAKENRMINFFDDMIKIPSNLCLYQCEEKCIETNGYVKVDTIINKSLKFPNYYYISSSESGSANVTNIESISNCSSYIGEIVNIQSNNNTYAEICISDDISIPLDLFYGEAILSDSLSSNTPFIMNNENSINNVIIYDFNYAIIEKHFSK